MLSAKHKCNEINTLVLSGAGNYGILLPIIKYLSENNILENIDTIYGVSAGSIVALGLSLGMNYEQMYDLILNKVDVSQIIKTDFKQIFNIVKTVVLTMA